jgi:hypothetical protein
MSLGQVSTQGELITVTEAVEESFALLLSGMLFEIVAVLSMVLPAETPLFTKYVATKVAISPLCRFGSVHVVVPVAPEVGLVQLKAGPLN